VRTVKSFNGHSQEKHNNKKSFNGRPQEELQCLKSFCCRNRTQRGGARYLWREKGCGPWNYFFTFLETNVLCLHVSGKPQFSRTPEPVPCSSLALVAPPKEKR